MADPNTRQGKRTPVTLKIKFKSETLEQFIERYAVDVSQGGIFIRTKEPLAVGTQMKFEFQLRDASPLIAGEGTVVWTRENDPSRPAIAPGMGVRFDRLAEGSQSVLEKILAEKAKQAPQRGSADSTKPPMFTDTPTRVAPAAIQEQLLGPSSDRSGRRRVDSEQTPLPKPMPFHSDADEFGAEAFEEATKVRSLDELAAQSASVDSDLQRDVKTAQFVMPADELALRRQSGRADSTSPLVDPPTPSTDPVPDRDSAPVLPSPPEATGASASGRAGKLLDTSPSPRSQTPSSPPPRASVQLIAAIEPAVPASSGSKRESTDKLAAPAATARESSARPTAPQRPSSAPIVIGALVVVAAALVALWFFVLRDTAADQVAQKTTNNTSVAPIDTTHDTTHSPGSAATMVGTTDTAKPAAPLVETEIASNIAKSTVTVVDTDQTGPAPFKAKLEKDKLYKVRVEAPGYARYEMDVKGGQDKAIGKLVAKSRVLSISSDPPGAAIVIENAATGKVTPFDVELTAAQAAKPKLHVVLRKNGFRPVDQMVDAATFADEDTRMVAKIDARLAVMVQATPNPGTPTGTHTGTSAGSATTGTGAGSATTSAGTGAGSDTGGGAGSAKEPSTTGTGAGSAKEPSGAGSAKEPAPAPKPAGGAGSAEPEPDWSKH